MPLQYLDNPNSDAIKIMTIHSSKGLEFSFVILVGLNIESQQSTYNISEPKVSYVALTRATNKLLVITTKN